MPEQRHRGPQDPDPDCPEEAGVRHDHRLDPVQIN